MRKCKSGQFLEGIFNIKKDQNFSKNTHFGFDRLKFPLQYKVVEVVFCDNFRTNLCDSKSDGNYRR